jgi:hypothetical protein
MPHPGHKIHISLKTDEALRALVKIKPTKEMPGQEQAAKS